MRCIYCQGPTRVSNSREGQRLTYTWRRRICKTCGAIFTTQEFAQLDGSLLVDTAGHLEAFSMDKLFLSLTNCLQHRETPLIDARALCETIVVKLLKHIDHATIPARELIEITKDTLQHFDHAAVVQYTALHPLQQLH